MAPRSTRSKRRVRYAVVGLGHIAQAAVLPAFAHARRNSEIVALVSSDPKKRRELGREYGIDRVYGYDEYEECLRSGDVDAVYIALPNRMHREYTIGAARAGVHVLCEKPMAVTARDCEVMIAACERAGVRLMIAYRLHFEAATLKSVEVARSGRIGELRVFESTLTMQVRDRNIRIRADEGGGPLHDIGVYCINAARMLFRAEPIEVVALAANGGGARFAEVDEATSAVMRFPGERLATFTCSFGAARSGTWRLLGTKGEMTLAPAYGYTGEMKQTVTIGQRTRERVFAPRDQFAAELLAFSDCILKRREPEPSGQEGLADLRIIEALNRSARTGRAVRVAAATKSKRPGPEQEIHRPPAKKPRLVKVAAPGRG